MTFRDMGQSLDECVDKELADPRSLPIETGLLVEEAKLGCITAMLMCLDRPQRWLSSWRDLRRSERGGRVRSWKSRGKTSVSSSSRARTIFINS